MPTTLGFPTKLLAFLSAVVSISPSLENQHDLDLLTATKPDSFPGGNPLSPLFVGEDDQSSDRGSAVQADLPREPPQPEREGPSGNQARRNGERRTLRRQQAPRVLRERGIVKRRRTRNVRMRRPRLLRTSEGGQEPMELESPELLNQDISDQGYSSQELPDDGPGGESIPTGPATALTLDSIHDASALEEADTYSHCTRISLEAASEQDLDDGQTVEGLHQDHDSEDQPRINHSSQPEQVESEDGNFSRVGYPCGQQLVMDDYLDHLMRAQKEQQRLEEELECE